MAAESNKTNWAKLGLMALAGYGIYRVVTSDEEPDEEIEESDEDEEWEEWEEGDDEEEWDWEDPEVSEMKLRLEEMRQRAELQGADR